MLLLLLLLLLLLRSRSGPSTDRLGTGQRRIIVIKVLLLLALLLLPRRRTGRRVTGLAVRTLVTRRGQIERHGLRLGRHGHRTGTVVVIDGTASTTTTGRRVEISVVWRIAIAGSSCCGRRCRQTLDGQFGDDGRCGRGEGRQRSTRVNDVVLVLAQFVQDFVR